jgi:hypothetical protein
MKSVHKLAVIFRAAATFVEKTYGQQQRQFRRRLSGKSPRLK